MSEQKSRARAVVETLGSVELGVALMITASAASVLGTVFVQSPLPGGGPGALYARYGRWFAEWLITLGLADVFHATWFAVLLACLALNLACGTVARFAPRIEKLGMLLAHAGILVTLAGGLAYNLLGDKGVVVNDEGRGLLAENDTAVKYLSRRSNGYRPLPFTLRLDRFVAERYPSRMVLVGPKGESLAVTPVEGAESAPSWTSAHVTFERVIAEARQVVDVVEDENAPVNPAARFRLETSAGATEFWRFAVRASPAETLLRHNGRIAVAFDNELTAKVNDLPAEPRAYAIHRGTKRTVEIPAKAGQSFPLPNADAPARGEILDVLGEADNAPGPGLLIQLYADNQTRCRYAFAEFPFFSIEALRGIPLALPELDFVYYRPTLTFRVTRVDDWLDRDAPPRFRVEWWPQRGLGRRVDDVLTGELSGPLGTALTVLESRRRARIDVRYEPAKGRTGVDAAYVRVDWPAGPSRRWWISTSEADCVVRASEALALAYSASDAVREFRAEVRIGEPLDLPGRRPAAAGDAGDLRDVAAIETPATVRVNHPAERAGWQVFLEAGDPDAEPPVCALVVSRDPGLPLVYAGLVMLALGVFVACFVKRKATNTSADSADDADCEEHRETRNR